jgi:hypothetical protein
VSRPVTLYVVTATLARSADAGAVVAVVLAAASARSGYPAYAAGLLAATLSVPHLLGAVVARRLDAARDGRRVLAAACVTYGVALACAAASIGTAPAPVVAIELLLAGTAGPLLTGGLSSRLAALVPSDQHAQSRAQGWDAVTYGIAGTGGPAAVAVVSAWWSPLGALSCLSVLAWCAAVLILVLPRNTDARSDSSSMSVAEALSLVGRTGPLRRATAMTMVTAAVAGAVTVLAVAVGSSTGVSGAVLVAAFGGGNLGGSLLVTALPSSTEPEVRILRWVTVLALAYGLCALAPTPPWLITAFAAAGAANAPFFTATLAVRSQHSPPGARAQIFVSVAGLKIAASAAGTAAAGVVAGARGALLAAGLLLLVAVLLTAIDRRATQPQRTSVARSDLSDFQRP